MPRGRTTPDSAGSVATARSSPGRSGGVFPWAASLFSPENRQCRPNMTGGSCAKFVAVQASGFVVAHFSESEGYTVAGLSAADVLGFVLALGSSRNPEAMLE